MATGFDYTTGVGFKTIQSSVDYLYNTEYLQPNAFFPTRLTRIDKTIDSNGLYDEMFLDTFKGMYGTKDPVKYNDFLAHEVGFNGVDAPDYVLQSFLKVSGLQTAAVPLKKTALGAIEGKDESSSGSSKEVTLEFASDRYFKVLNWLRKWQEFWYIYTKRQHVLVSHTDDTLGEGYLGLDNLLIHTNGVCERISHLSIFGLIPIKIELESRDFGPQAQLSKLPVIKVNCICSLAVLAFPDPETPRPVTEDDKKTYNPDTVFYAFGN